MVCCAAFAQKTGKISGIIKTVDGQPIEAATVSLLKEQALVKVSITNKLGEFEFERIANGKFIVALNAAGFAPTSKEVEITAENQVINAGSFALNAQTKGLQEVQVSAKKPFIENKIDRMVVNVDASPTNAGLSALEVLEKSPGVLVDNDGNISIKGKSGVVVLIDGKPAYLNGQDLANYLKNMPSNQLDQLEIMTQPPARFDASGNSGVINIKTKKSKANGFNGSISSSAIFANYFKNTNSINVNWRKDKFNLFGNYGVSLWEGFNDITISRKFRDDRNSPFSRSFEQSSYGRFSGYPHNFKVGADYFATKNTTLGVVVSGLIDNRKFRSEGVSNIFNADGDKVERNISLSENKDPWTNYGYNLNFRQILDKKGAEITADADYILYRTEGEQFSDNYRYNPDGSLILVSSGTPNPYLLRGFLPANIDIYTFKSDYTRPIGKDAKLEAGFKVSAVKTDNDAQYTSYDALQDKWLNDATRSNRFVYKENINAAYLNYQQQIKKIGIQLGLRAEQTIAKGNQVTKGESFDRNYTQLFPTAYLSYKRNDNNTFGLSYGKRIERPGYQDLNPFQYLLDQYTYRQGNPLLLPQFSHNIELSYNYKGQLNIALNFTETNDIINDIIQTEIKAGEPNPYTFQTKGNVAKRINSGLAISYNKPLTKWWNTSLYGNVYNNAFDGFVGTEKIKLDITSFNININNQFNFPKGWSAEISGFYNHKNFVSSVILAEPMGAFSFGARKQLLKNTLTIGLNVRDPFWLQKFRGSTDLDKFVTTIQSKWDNRRFIVSVTYRFGKQMQQQRKRSSASQDEQNRVNLGGQQ